MSEIPERVRKELTLIPVKHMDEVLPLALEGWKEFEAKLNKKRGSKKSAKAHKKSAAARVTPAKKTVKKAAPKAKKAVKKAPVRKAVKAKAKKRK